MPLGVVVAQSTPDVVGASWWAIAQGGAVAILLFAALYLIGVRGTLRTEREVTERDARLAKQETESAKELAEAKADCAKQMADLRADYERQMADLRARITEITSGYEQRISKYEAEMAKQEAMLFDLAGAARSLASVSLHREDHP